MVEIDWLDSAVGNTIRLVLGMKNIPWQRQQGMAKKYKSRCVMRFDNVVIVGESACTILIEDTVPNPSLFPNGNKGMPMALASWRDKVARGKGDSFFKAQALLVMRQMVGERPFLQGPHMGLADIQAGSWVLLEGIYNHVDTIDGVAEWAERLSPYLLSQGDNDLLNVAIPKSIKQPNTAGGDVAIYREVGLDDEGLSITIMHKSDLLIWGRLDNGDSVCLSPLSHSVV